LKKKLYSPVIKLAYQEQNLFVCLFHNILYQIANLIPKNKEMLYDFD